MWVAVLVVAALALVATLVEARSRPRRRAARPVAGEVWWALVPYEDGDGEKDRPCLVVGVRGEVARVLKITTKPHQERAGVIALPTGAVGDARGRASFLETDEERDVPLGHFRRRVGPLDRGVWRQVRRRR
jgi:hypothetical protein